MTPEELLLKLCADPDDDALRSVLADALLEAGDPRGQFISLQMLADQDGASVEQHHLANLLLKKRRGAWLGALEPWVDAKTVTFSKGFVSRCTLLSEAVDQVAWRGEPTVALLDELRVPEVPGAALVSLLRALPRLRGLGLPSSRALPPVLDAPMPWSLRQLGLAGTAASVLGDLERVAQSNALPSLRRLSLRLTRFGRSAMVSLSRGLQGHRLAAKLTHLVIEADADSNHVGYAVSALAAALPEAAVSFENARLVVRRAPSGVVSMRGSTGASALCKVLSGLNLVAAPKLLVQQLGGELPSELDVETVKNDLRRLKPRLVDLPSSWGL